MAKKAKDTRQRYVYLIRCRGVYKIGNSVDPDARLPLVVRSGEHGEVLSRFPSANAYRLEYALHCRFADKALGGEWFALDEDEAALIATVERADEADDLPEGLRPAPGAERGNRSPYGDHPGKPPARRTGKHLDVFVDERLLAVLEEYLEIETEEWKATLNFRKPTKTSAVELGLIMLFEADGMWPPKDGEDES